MELGGTPLGCGVSVALANIEVMAACFLRRAREGAYLRAQLTGDGFRDASRRAFYRPPRMNLVQWTEEYRHHTEFSKAKGSKVTTPHDGDCAAFVTIGGELGGAGLVFDAEGHLCGIELVGLHGRIIRQAHIPALARRLLDQDPLVMILSGAGHGGGAESHRGKR